MDAPVTIVAPYRDLPIPMVENFLRSIKLQTVQPEDIVVVDLGHDEGVDIGLLCAEYQVRCIHAASPIWCKALALNIGLRSVLTPGVAFFDIDTVLSRQFVERMADVIEDPTVLALCRVDDLPGVSYDAIRIHLEADTLRGTPRQMKGAIGGCQAGATSWFMAVRGYDEFFTGWGGEDTDIVHRAVRGGLRTKLLNGLPGVTLWHQPHSRPEITTGHIRKLNRYAAERAREVPFRLARNGPDWGTP